MPGPETSIDQGRKYKDYIWNKNGVPRKTLYRIRQKKSRLKKCGEKDEVPCIVERDSALAPNPKRRRDVDPYIQENSGCSSDPCNSQDNTSTASISNTSTELEDQNVCGSFQSTSIASARRSSLDSVNENFNDIPCEDSKDDDLDEKLYPESNITLKQSLLMIMAHIIRFQASKEATSSLLKLLQAHLPGVTNLPHSLYLFYKHFEAAKSQFTTHIYCSNNECKAYIGISSEKCVHCMTFVCEKRALENGNYFITFPIEDQIRGVLENVNYLLNLDCKNSHLKEGRMYKKLDMRLQDLSITWNTDGVPVFHSSGFSIWPLLYVINEIDVGTNSGKNVHLASLWFGFEKPEMNTFLKPFVDQMNILSRNGFTFKSGETSINIKVFPGPCSCDSVARCVIQNINQFNGAYGCSWCLNEGKSVKKGRGHCRIYEVLDSEPRTAQQMKSDATATVLSNCKNTVNGVKGFTSLMLLDHFDTVDGFVVDYMHGVCQGVVKATTLKWFDSCNFQEPYYLGKQMKEINGIYLSLKPSDEITRTPRSISDRKQWKANEWRSWLLYYSPLLLKSVLPSNYYRNWLKLVLGIRLLLSCNISAADITEAADHLRSFVKQYEKLYGIENMSYNMHLLLHMHETVANWGPLWAISCFQFENMNGKIMKLFHGTQKIALQISEKIVIMRKMSQLHPNAFNNNEHLLNYYEDLLRGYPLLKKVTFFGSNTFAQGLPNQIILEESEKDALQVFMDKPIVGRVSKFVKMTICGMTFSCKEKAKRRNCGVKMKDGTIGILFGFYGLRNCICDNTLDICGCETLYYAIIKPMKSYETSTIRQRLLSMSKTKKKLKAYPISEIDEKLLILESPLTKDDFIFSFTFPNLYECD